jgi:hypothetical protein
VEVIRTARRSPSTCSMKEMRCPARAEISIMWFDALDDPHVPR